MRFMLVLAAALALTATTVSAQTQASAVELRAGLVGAWEGALGYRDYQSNELFELPVQTWIDAVADGKTLVQRSVFDDGPSGAVWITTTSLHDPVADTVTAASFRAGRAPELITDTVRVTDYRDATHWTLVYSRTGEDDDAPVDIRLTETRDGDALLSVKEVRPVGAGDDAWRFRNQTRLNRRVPD